MAKKLEVVKMKIFPTNTQKNLLMDTQDHFVMAINKLVEYHKDNGEVIESAYQELKDYPLPSVLKNRAVYEAFRIFTKASDEKFSVEKPTVVYSSRHYSINKEKTKIHIPIIKNGKCKRTKIPLDLQTYEINFKGSLRITEDNGQWYAHLAIAKKKGEPKC